MTATPAIEGWFSTGPEPALLGTRCLACSTTYFPPERTFCRNPACSGEEFAEHAFSRRGTVWSYTDAQYQPPPPYVAPEPPASFVPFGIAAVELPEGLVVLGQLAEGYGVADVRVGSTVELVVETLYADASGDRSIWRWKPVPEGDEEVEQ